EVGFPPMQALQSIAVINNRPTIWGDGALALVRASGLLLDFEEGFEGEGEDMKAFCRCVRKDQKTPIVRTFSVKQAKAARLWSKKGPWTDYKARMMAMRARAFALRDGFADVLKGLAVREEVQDYRPMQKSEAEAISGEELIEQAAEGEKIVDAEFSEATTSGEEPESPTPESGDEQASEPAGSTKSSEQAPPSPSEEGSPPVASDKQPPLGGEPTPAEDAPETPVEESSPDTPEKPEKATPDDDVKPSGEKTPA
ncbi:MAG: recombinase RecT, partial [Rhodospirillaceae bacterium]|nr:recombinase RecT [Rhodospirillaceae bacterium]